ncbi:hypothetical protein PPL_07380 [Heterostelium album PN500]|uniref:Uncharacterized protein n=1 Tax=Heterostelium pallidum (strain ATCC 26659 / Pp 5 / PN500) TaxID=670386 RepID=D3BFS9_HETP5|nr:hypothetical protein PPL_07380 [Heterostelium album PN500]EFA79689.1 hypothetical protein PPL_07380 [Heterostelium album PN500]|eukprot:XP_020431810.1 hypothetical protein PPL_07380 [Heterostelium album PN500]
MTCDECYSWLEVTAVIHVIILAECHYDLIMITLDQYNNPIQYHDLLLLNMSVLYLFNAILTEIDMIDVD